MNILAFDTSSSACSVAIQRDDEVFSSHVIAPMQQAKLILPTIEELMAAASLKLNQLDAIAYGRGPGSFTGIRIASSVVQGLGFGAQLPIIQVSSLAAIAQTAYMKNQPASWSNLLVALDARMEQIYWAEYEVNPQGLAVLKGQEIICTVDETPIPSSRTCYGVGEGWEKYGDKLTRHLGFSLQAIEPGMLPDAKAILALASVKFEQSDWTPVEKAVPAYLR